MAPPIKWGNTGNYSTSILNAYMDEELYDAFSDNLKSMVATVKVDISSLGSNNYVNTRVFAPSGREVCAPTYISNEGEPWEAFQIRMGTTALTELANGGRALSIVEGTKQPYWLRTYKTTNIVYLVNSDGAITDAQVTASTYYTACVFIPKTTPPPVIDPNNPTLSNLKLAIATGSPQDYYPIGTEIPDTWNGNSNPLIVAHYTDITLSDGTVKPGAYLVRKYADITKQWNTPTVSGVIYDATSIRNYMDTGYFDLCSEGTQNTVANIKITVAQRSRHEIDAKFFLMSGSNVGSTLDTSEGIFWDYWKEKTGLTAPDIAKNPGRMAYTRNGGKADYWTRSAMYPGPNVTYIDTAANYEGNFSVATQGTSQWVLAACAIVADD